MLGTHYRVLLATSLAAAIVGVVISFLEQPALPSELQAYWQRVNEEPIDVSDVVALAVGLPVLFAVLTAMIGLYLFKSWARTLAVIATVVGMLLTPILGPVAHSGWVQFFYDSSLLLWGIVLALSYWSPVGAGFSPRQQA